MTKIIVAILAFVVVGMASRSANAQWAPTGDHYGGKPTDTGFAGQVNSGGGYQTTVPLSFPPTRDGTAIPLQIVSGGRRVGAAGLGWDIPLSYIRVDQSIARRKPVHLPNEEVQVRGRVFLSLGGEIVELVPSGASWVARTDHALLTATQQSTTWTLSDGTGRVYTFSLQSGMPHPNQWMLSNIRGPSGDILDLVYDVEPVSLTGGTAASINLTAITYNSNLGTPACSKNEIDLTYGADNYQQPLSLSVVSGDLFARTNYVTSVAVRAKGKDCSSAQMLKSYLLQYTPDADTTQPQLSSVIMYGRTGNTPGSQTAIPVATYHYGTATNNGALTYQLTSHIALPAAADPTEIASTGTSSMSLPVSGYVYATGQTLADITGDGIPDIVYQDQSTRLLTVERGVVDATGATTYGAAVAVGGTVQVNGPFEDRTLSQRRFDYGTGGNRENIWRQVIDVNGDGRLDIVDATEKAGQWTVYLNKADTNASGVVWEKRAIPVDAIVSQLTAAGHVIDNTSYLPLGRRFTGEDYAIASNGNPYFPTYGLNERTYVEWELKDINGDGYPDFVFNQSPVVYHSFEDPHMAGYTDNELTFANGIDAVEVMFNVAGIMLSNDDNSIPGEAFSAPWPLIANTSCGVEYWANYLDAGVGSTTTPPAASLSPALKCTFVDVTGDGIPDRIENNSVYIGLGDGFSAASIALPLNPDNVDALDGVERTLDPESASCPPSGNSASYISTITDDLRDLTGDGIPDLIVYNNNGAQKVFIGTGAGFAPPISVNGVYFNPQYNANSVINGLPLSIDRDNCDGSLSTTVDGVFDIDGDGKPEFVEVGTGGSEEIFSLVTASGSAPGVPEAGLLTAIDNGYGATTSIAYRSAKQDTATAHDIPFSEVVASKVSVSRVSQQSNDTLSPTLYAYGNASLMYDDVSSSYEFPGYLRTISLQVADSGGTGPAAQSKATIVDRFGLPAYVSGSSNQTRYWRQMMVGQVSAESTLSGSVGDDPWQLLGINPALDARVIDVATHVYASRLFEEPALSPYTNDYWNCLDYPDSYDFDDSKDDAVTGYNTCSAHGFTYESYSTRSHGEPLSSGVAASTYTYVDDYDRLTRSQWSNLNDTTDSDCTDITYADPEGSGAPILSAQATRKTWNCVDASPVVYAIESWFYDGLAIGSVTKGQVTEHAIERHNVSDGSLLNTVDVADATYDAFGNVATITRTRDSDHAVRQTAYSYDPFGLAEISSTTTGTEVPTFQTSIARDANTLAVLSTTDVNGVVRTATYDSFGRINTTGISSSSGPSGDLSYIQYLGFTDSSGRRIVTTTFDAPVPVAQVTTAAGHITTTYYDELGRELRDETQLGSDYASQVLVQNYRNYDQLGRVSFQADPFESSVGAANAYGTTQFFNTDGTQDLSIRATGRLTSRIDQSDASSDIYPTEYYCGYSNHLATIGVSAPDANVLSGPQAGVVKLAALDVRGHVLSRTTTSGGAVIEYETFDYDKLGNVTSMSRYADPASASGTATSSWNYDSLGNVVKSQAGAAVPQNMTYDSWNELTTIQWSSAAGSATDYRVIAEFDALGRITHRQEQTNAIPDPATLMNYTYDTAAPAGPYLTQTNVNGRLAQAFAPTSTTYLSYDEFGAVNGENHVDENGTSYVEAYGLRPDGTPTGIDLFLPDVGYTNEHVSYQYDSAARLSAIDYGGPSDPAQSVFKVLSKDPRGRVLHASYGATDFAATYAPSGRELLTRTVISSYEATYEFDYTGYDEVGRELSRTDASPFYGTNVINDSYDALGRVATRTQNGASQTYSYDPLGNITQMNGEATGSATSTTTVLGYANGTANWEPDRVCQIGYAGALSGSNCDVTYDDVGNVTSEPSASGQRQFTYYNDGKIKDIVDGEITAVFRYDPFGILQELDVDGSENDNRRDRYYGSIIASQGVEAPTIARNIPGVNASLRGISAGWVFDFSEPRGSRFTADEYGNFLEEVSYSTFGSEPSLGGGGNNYTDWSTQMSRHWNDGDQLFAFGLVNLGARVYDPAIGRFLSRDPLGIRRTASITNPYAFANNDPINLSDPTGLDPPECFDQGCGPVLIGPFGGGGHTGGSTSGHSNGTSTTGKADQSPPIGDSTSYWDQNYQATRYDGYGHDVGTTIYHPHQTNYVHAARGIFDTLMGMIAPMADAAVLGPSAVSGLGPQGPASAVASYLSAPQSERDIDYQDFAFATGVFMAVISAGEALSVDDVILNEKQIANELSQNLGGEPVRLYRSGGSNPGSLKLREGEDGLSFGNSLSNPLNTGKGPVFRPGDQYIVIDSRLLPPDAIVPDDVPPGHVTITGVEPADIIRAIIAKGKLPK